MQLIVDSFDNLRKYISDLEDKFIKSYIPANPEIGPKEYEHFVKAYCILSHAAIEEYVEEVALKVMKRSIEDWKTKKKIVDSLLSIVTYYGLRLKIDEWEEETKVFDYLRKIIDEAKDKFSKDVDKNHGIRIQDLRNLLIPVGIDIMQDLNIKNSLHRLSSERGVYAHYQNASRKGARKVISPEDAKNCVDDCIKLCEDIKNKAVRKFNGA